MGHHNEIGSGATYANRGSVAVDGSGAHALRGVSTSISVVLMLVALLFLVASIAHYSAMMGESNTRLAQVSGAQEQYDMASYGARRLAEEYGMKVSISGNRTSFTQDLAQMAYMLRGMDEWAAFLSAYGGGNITMNASVAQNISVYPQNASVYPQNSSMSAWSSLAGCGNFTLCVLVSPNGSNVSIYNVTVAVNAWDPKVNSSSGRSQPPSCYAYETEIDVRANGFGGTTNGTSVCLSRAAGGNVSIKAGGVNALVKLGSDGHLEFDYAPESGTYAYLTVIAEMDSNASYAESLGPDVAVASGTVTKKGKAFLG